MSFKPGLKRIGLGVGNDIGPRGKCTPVGIPRLTTPDQVMYAQIYFVRTALSLAEPSPASCGERVGAATTRPVVWPTVTRPGMSQLRFTINPLLYYWIGSLTSKLPYSVQ